MLKQIRDKVFVGVVLIVLHNVDVHPRQRQRKKEHNGIVERALIVPYNVSVRDRPLHPTQHLHLAETHKHIVMRRIVLLNADVIDRC
jgi:hypothetical protein